MDQEETFAEGNCIATLGTLLKEQCLKKMFGPCITFWQRIMPEEIDMSMGMGTEGYARPKSRGTLSKLKAQLEDQSDGGVKKQMTEEEIETETLRKAEEEAEVERRRLVPLEYKYRKQLELPPRVLNHKASEMLADGKKLVERVKLEVVDEATILENYDMSAFDTNIDIDPIDSDDEETGFDIGGGDESNGEDDLSLPSFSSIL